MAIRQGKIGGGETHVLDLVKEIDRSMFNPYVLSFTKGPMVNRLEEMNVPCYVIYTEKPFDVRVWKKVQRLLIELNIDVVHAHGTRANSNTFWAAKKLSLPMVYTVHGWSFHQNQKPFLNKIKVNVEKFLTSKSNTVINVSISNQEEGIKRFNMKRSIVIYNGVNTKKFNPYNQFNDVRKKLKISENKILVGYLVRMTLQKDPYTMIRAIHLVLKKTKDMVFLMVGDGDLRKSTETLAKKLNVSDHVIFTGFRNDIPDILNAIDIYCLPSLWEGLPIGLLEAMAMKKTVLASAVDGSVEVVKHEKNGLLISCQKPQELADSLLRLNNDRKLMLSLGSNAKYFIEKNFNVKKMTRETEGVYKKLIVNNRLKT